MVKNLKKVMAATLMVATMVVPQLAQAKPAKDGEVFKLTILQTNDLHGHLDEEVTLADGTIHHNSIARYATVIKEVRAKEDNVLVLDGGDIFLRGPFQTGQGELESAILKEIKYDAMVLGNNDFRVYPAGEGDPLKRYEQLKDYQRTFNFPIVLGNVVYSDTQKYLQTVKPYKNFNFKGTKVGVIGMTSMKPQMRGWEDVADLTFIEPDEALNQLVPQVSKKTDINVVLSHAGNPADHEMAKNVADIDVIIGADTHKIIRTPEMVANESTGQIVPITQAGGEVEHYLGRIDLTFRRVDGEMVLVDTQGYLYDVSDVVPDAKVQKIIDDYRMTNGLY